MWRAIGGSVLCLLALQSARQMPVWASNRALWTHATTVSPTAVRAWMNLAAAGMEEGDCSLTQTAFTRAAPLASTLTHCGVLERQRDWLQAFCPAAARPSSPCWP